MYSDINRSFDFSYFLIDILFSKEEHYSICGVPLNWFKDYLSNIHQYV